MGNRAGIDVAEFGWSVFASQIAGFACLVTAKLAKSAIGKLADTEPVVQLRLGRASDATPVEIARSSARLAAGRTGDSYPQDCIAVFFFLFGCWEGARAHGAYGTGTWGLGSGLQPGLLAEVHRGGDSALTVFAVIFVLRR